MQRLVKMSQKYAIDRFIGPEITENFLIKAGTLCDISKCIVHLMYKSKCAGKNWMKLSSHA